MALSRISPALIGLTRTARDRVDAETDWRPPWVLTSKPSQCASPVTRRTSTDSTSTWLPKRCAISAIQLGRRITGYSDGDLVGAGAQETVDVLDGETPPPTVSGMKTCSAVAERSPSWPSWGGDVEEGQLVGALGVVQQRNSTGSPASRRSWS